MALMPKRVKYRKQQRGRRSGTSLAASTLNFGQYGLKALESAWITDKQIEAARVAIMRTTGRAGKMWFRIFPDKSITKTAAETRMGKGKGSPVGWVAVVKKGRIILEMEGIPMDLAKTSMRLAAFKLPLRTKFISRGGVI
ncbi:MAG TPA: 50S ribosomal protein L16 [Candidatus Omnitrophota bacterium]|nr:50S ribosomal protein L16 [Candidatus Omnitrophota bacterium]HPS20237.1 50S ribosomal protein L16 [Candidatus Omnitrophota bacterium]